VLQVVLILIGIASVCAGTLDRAGPALIAVAATCTGIVAALFFVEYGVRLWVAPELPRFHDLAAARARLRWAVSGEGLIDLLAVIPALAAASGGARLGAESASAFVLLWVLKLAHYAPGIELIARVVRHNRSALSAALVLFFIVLFSAATLIHLLEGERQPEPFGSIPASLWWAMVTLTTTGYGDVIPQTALGRIVGGAVMLCGIAVLALLAGILAMGFADEVRRREFTRIWDLVTRVPFFAEVGAVAISEIAAQLRSRNYPQGAYVVRKGEAGDSMYFIVSGEVEVRIGGPVRALRDGDFFGEMALIDRKPRSADVVTLTPCTLLVLDVADFYQLAARQPALIAAIQAEADRRRGTDSGRSAAGR
jgi:voltage-gated potassium channel